MHHPAPWLLAAGLAAVLSGCGGESPDQNQGSGSPGAIPPEGSGPTSADQVVSNKGVLFTKGNTAWSRTTADDAALVKAMRIGKVMVIRGQSSRGTKTKDTFELFGFTAAHNAINKACRVK